MTCPRCGADSGPRYKHCRACREKARAATKRNRELRLKTGLTARQRSIQEYYRGLR